MPRLLTAFALVISLGLAAPARADQVRFTGVTTVDAVVIRDALQNILRVAASAQGCNQLTAVEASLLPQGWAPADRAERGAPADARYERWDVTLCGRVVPFLMGFWTAPEGGTMFMIGHPYPADAPAAAPAR